MDEDSKNLSRTPWRAIALLIGVSSLIRLTWAASLGGFTNEAYYYLYARNLAWGFFDHPPMVAFISAAGLSVASWVSPIFGLRLGFIALFAGSTWLLARLTARSFGDRAAMLAALTLNITIFFGVKVSTLAEPDGPLLFFWLLTLDRLDIALRSRSPFAWMAAGAAWGLAMSSKYHAILLPAGLMLYLVVWPPARRILLTRGPYLAVLSGLLVFSPVIAWNASHGWISFVYQGSRAHGFHGFQLAMFLEGLAGQILYLTPWVWVGLVAVLVRLLKKGPRGWSEAEAFLICQAIPALGLFVAVSTTKRIMPHWPLIGFVSLMPLLGRKIADRLEGGSRAIRWSLIAATATPILLGSLFVIQARWGWFQDDRGRVLGKISALEDPTVDTIRWAQIARELDRRGLMDDPETFLFTDHWRYSSELAMATGREARVACLARDARSFTFWSRPQQWVGRDALFVSIDETTAVPSDYAPWFARIEPLESIPIVRNGTVMQVVHLYRCVRNTDPFPFGYAGKGKIPLPDSGRETRAAIAGTKLNR